MTTKIYPKASHAKANSIRMGVTAYLRDKYGSGDKTWHPLFTAARDLFAYLMEAPECRECDGTGLLDELGGDWGKTPDRRVPCWKCNGTGDSKGDVR